MKNTLFSLLSLFSLVCMTYSCQDDNENGTADIGTGSWYYESPHFVFDYSSDYIRINMGSPANTKSWAVEDIKRSFPLLADEKMKAYFEGIDFLSEDQMNIKMQFAEGRKENLKANYRLKDHFLEVSLDAGDLERLSGKKLNIPKISFRYISSAEGNLTLCFDKIYVTAMASMMLDQILDMVLPSLIPAYPHLPEIAQSAIAASFKTQVNQILEQTRTLEIGINLKR